MKPLRRYSCARRKTTYHTLYTILCLTFTGAFGAAQALEVLALVLMILGAVLVAVYVFVASTRGKCFAITACGLCLSAGKQGMVL